jgi:ubiquinone/menaquinone biosynthesis C-methylase UbiE
MAEFKSRNVFKLARGFKLFLHLEVGVTRSRGVNSKPGRKHAEKIRRKQDRFDEQRGPKQDRRPEHRPKAQLSRSYEVYDPDAVNYKGVVLPPKRARPCGASYKNNEYYLFSAKRDAAMLVENLGLSLESCLLDVGCGPGRLAIGILESVGEIEKYRGVDVKEDFVRWGQRHITPKHPNFRFIHIDVENPRYHLSGAKIETGFAFPFAEEEFDIITLYSVFTHMLADDIRTYLNEFQRMLRPTGRIFLTAFLEDGVPPVTENPEGYLGQEWKGPLHCVRYNREFFEALLDENGFRLDNSYRIGDKSKGDAPEEGQSGLYISRKAL